MAGRRRATKADEKPEEARPMTPAEMGRKGGSKTGETKRRGDSAYYRELRAKRKEKR